MPARPSVVKWGSDMFKYGPFIFSHGGLKSVNTKPQRTWTLHYGSDFVAQRTLPGVDISEPAAIEAFADEVAAFKARAQSEHAPDVVHLIDFETGDAVAAIECATDPGLTPGLIDDRSRYWLRSANRLRSRNVTLSEFAARAAEHAAPPLHWVAGLLPDDVLTTSPDDWRSPTSWEIRHIVGEGSFTRVTGAKAAELVGVSAQNFRKYLAADDARTRQRMSFAMWHLLLHRLGVQRLVGAA